MDMNPKLSENHLPNFVKFCNVVGTTGWAEEIRLHDASSLGVGAQSGLIHNSDS